MTRQSHKLRSVEGTYGWFVSRFQEKLQSPPRREFFLNLEDGDLFIHWIGDMNCQVWLFSELRGGLWVPVAWGHPIDRRHLVITDGGSPSLVAAGTWGKTYRRKPSRIII